MEEYLVILGFALVPIISIWGTICCVIIAGRSDKRAKEEQR